MDQRALSGALSLVLGACGAGERPDRPTVEVASFPAVPSRELDLLFQLDDSNGTAEIHPSLAAAIPALLDSLARIDGGLPNLHLGVVTSDLGTTGSLDPANPAPPVGVVGQGGCSDAGGDGVLVTGNSTLTDAFLVDEDDGAGGRRRNYQGSIEATLQQMFQVGGTGCGFEQPLAATRRALTRPDQAAFLRSEASLAVVLVADEDDCSVRDPQLFTSDETELGPQQSFRCTRNGIVCGEPLDEAGPKTGCTPREDSAFIEGIEPFEQFLLELKPGSERVVLAGIFGDPAPVEVDLRTINGVSQLALVHSCQWERFGSTGFADPAVRMAALVDRAASRGARTTVCKEDLTPNLRQIGMTIKRSLGVACIDTARLLDSSDADGIQPACEVADVDASNIVTAIPACPAAGTCYELRADPGACPETTDHARVVITRAEQPSAGTRVDVRCEVASR